MCWKVETEGIMKMGNPMSKTEFAHHLTLLGGWKQLVFKQSFSWCCDFKRVISCIHLCCPKFWNHNIHRSCKYWSSLNSNFEWPPLKIQYLWADCTAVARLKRAIRAVAPRFAPTRTLFFPLKARLRQVRLDSASRGCTVLMLWVRIGVAL